MADTSTFHGVVAALLAPAFSAGGLILWDKHWAGSAFALNLTKCSLATILNVVTVCVVPPGIRGLAEVLDARTAAALCTSAFIGIVIGDITWLASMARLGARRIILVDIFKPLMAAAAGRVAFGERPSALGLVCMAVAMGGVFVVAVEREGTQELRQAPPSPQRKAEGYLLGIVNLVLDVLGAVITRSWGGKLTACAISFVRFGFSAVCLGVVALAASAARAAAQGSPARQPQHLGPKPLAFSTAPEGGGAQVETEIMATSSSQGRGEVADLGVASWMEAKPADPAEGEEDRTAFLPTGFWLLSGGWHRLPRMPRADWLHVVAGTLFTTYLATISANVALFLLPLGLCLTLTSLGPVFSLPLVFAIKGERVSLLAAVFTVVTVAGASGFALVELDQPPPTAAR